MEHFLVTASISTGDNDLGLFSKVSSMICKRVNSPLLSIAIFSFIISFRHFSELIFFFSSFRSIFFTYYITIFDHWFIGRLGLKEVNNGQTLKDYHNTYWKIFLQTKKKKKNYCTRCLSVFSLEIFTEWVLYQKSYQNLFNQGFMFRAATAKECHCFVGFSAL